MKGIDIFNVKAISLKIKKPKVPGVYTRVYNATKGNTSGLTVPLIDELIKIVESDSASFLDELKALKSQIIESNPKKKVIKKAA